MLSQIFILFLFNNESVNVLYIKSSGSWCKKKNTDDLDLTGLIVITSLKHYIMHGKWSEYWPTWSCWHSRMSLAMSAIMCWRIQIKTLIKAFSILYVSCPEDKTHTNLPTSQNWPDYREMFCCLHGWMWCLKGKIFTFSEKFGCKKRNRPMIVTTPFLHPPMFIKFLGSWSRRARNTPFKSKGRNGILGDFIFLKESLYALWFSEGSCEEMFEMSETLQGRMHASVADIVGSEFWKDSKVMIT